MSVRERIKATYEKFIDFNVRILTFEFFLSVDFKFRTQIHFFLPHVPHIILL